MGTLGCLAARRKAARPRVAPAREAVGVDEELRRMPLRVPKPPANVPEPAHPRRGELRSALVEGRVDVPQRGRVAPVGEVGTFGPAAERRVRRRLRRRVAVPGAVGARAEHLGDHPRERSSVARQEGDRRGRVLANVPGRDVGVEGAGVEEAAGCQRDRDLCAVAGRRGRRQRVGSKAGCHLPARSTIAPGVVGQVVDSVAEQREASRSRSGYAVRYHGIDSPSDTCRRAPANGRTRGGARRTTGRRRSRSCHRRGRSR